MKANLVRHRDLNDYACRLYERQRSEAEALLRLTIGDGTGWLPQPVQCHDNARRVANANPNNYELVNGWHVCDYGYEFGFIAHSVVRDRTTGRLIDITPTDDPFPSDLFLPDADPNYWVAADASRALNPQMLKCAAYGRGKDEDRITALIGDTDD